MAKFQDAGLVNIPTANYEVFVSQKVLIFRLMRMLIGENLKLIQTLL